ncbi:hypothetical protein V6N13_140383 [Hibiscus sabdariffa]|uniref:GST N-terminal domain-containing protein n=1 Tax=Hibiscus sabdariffa TaxID=183260 RepID=A0ABR2QAP2_9ROSI
MQCISHPGCHLRLHTPPKTSFKSACHVSPKMSLNDDNNSKTTTSSSNNGLNLINNISKLLWGPSLPPGLLVSTVRTAWTSTWQLMMSQLAPSDPSGGYTRPPSKFRLSRQTPTATKLHLYVGLPCPWAHRTLIVRALKGLEEAIPVSIAAPGLDGSWKFNDIPYQGKSRDGDTLVPTRDKINGCRNLKEVYRLRGGGYEGRATVPMLWDVDQKEVICNESYDIIEFFNSGLNGLAQNPGLDLSPAELRGEMEEWNRVIYPNVNNGVYRCGFAQSQEAYDVAANGLFNTLDKMEDHLGGSRFDAVYNVLFKCTKKKLLEFPNLHAYMRDIYQIPKVAGTCNFPAIMDGYYRILFPLNPGSIRPHLPSGCDHEFLSTPHNRESMSPADKRVQYVS